METVFAVNTRQKQQPIPTEIYDSLWNIAVHGYQAQHVHMWYQTMLQDLRQIAPQGGQTGITQAGLQPEASIATQPVDFLDTDCAARRSTMATIDSCISPVSKLQVIPSTESLPMEGPAASTTPMYTFPAHDNVSQAYNTPQSYQTYGTTPQQLESTPEPPHNQLMPAWSPAPSSVAESDLYAMSSGAPLSNGNLMAFAGEPGIPTYPWFAGQNTGSLHTRTRSQQSHISQISQPSSTADTTAAPLPAPTQQQQQQQQQQLHIPEQPYLAPEFNTQLPGVAMPVLVPYASSSGSGNYTKAAAIPTGPGASFYSSSAGYFPIIHVSSSRRRRKALQKGVKKMVQPLKGRRQQSV